MMNKVYQSSASVVVTSPTAPYVNISGITRWNHNTQCLEVMGHGNDWYRLEYGIGSIGLTAEAEEVISWARQKMVEESKLQELLRGHPGLKELKDKYEIMLALVQDKQC